MRCEQRAVYVWNGTKAGTNQHWTLNIEHRTLIQWSGTIQNEWNAKKEKCEKKVAGKMEPTHISICTSTDMRWNLFFPHRLFSFSARVKKNIYRKLLAHWCSKNKYTFFCLRLKPPLCWPRFIFSFFFQMTVIIHTDRSHINFLSYSVFFFLFWIFFFRFWFVSKYWVVWRRPMNAFP